MARARARSSPLRRRLPTSLGAKLVAILTGIGLLGAGAVTLLLAYVITPSFDRLERNATDGQVAHARAALTDFAAKVEVSARDHGRGDVLYAAMGERHPSAEKISGISSAAADQDIDGLAYVNTAGQIVPASLGVAQSRQDQVGMQAGLRNTMRAVDVGKALAGQDSTSFYARIGDRIAAFGVAEVRRSDGSGPPRGHVVMARLLNPATLSHLLHQPSRLDFKIPVPRVTVTPHERHLSVAVPLRDAGGAPVASAIYDVPRDLSSLGRSMLTLAVIGTTLLLLGVMAVLSWMVTRLVLRPLNRVERHMGLVRASGNLTLLEDTPRLDEIGRMVGSFNAMLSQLKALREQVEAQSFKLGQSESAVAVMHNVRNALNPISTVLSQGLAQAPLADRTLLNRAIAELADPDIPQARRQKLAAFLAAIVESEADARVTRQQRLEICRDALHNVQEIIGRQQEQTHERPPLDTCDVAEIIARNATIARYSGGSSIAFHFPSRPCWVLANRVLLSQVIGNLFSNAAEAIAATGREGGSISVGIHRRGSRVEVLIRDDGEGFDPEAAPTLFQRGYSTRGDKSGGLGLHWCANSMLAMGGSLTLKSEGRGFGARAVLSLQASAAMREDVAA